MSSSTKNRTSRSSSGRRKRSRTWIYVTLAVLGVWLVFNPPGRVGLHGYGFTVYSGVPFPMVDLLIRADGYPGIRETRVHEISMHEYEEFVDSHGSEEPEVVIIGTGYKEQVRVAKPIFTAPGPAVEALNSKEALRRFKELQRAGKKVALLLHSTC